MIFCVLRRTWSFVLIFVFVFAFVFVCIYALCFCAATDFSVNKDLYNSNYTVRQKETTYLFMNKSFITQCNPMKFRTLVGNEYYHRCYLFNFWNLHYFSQVTVKKV